MLMASQILDRIFLSWICYLSYVIFLLQIKSVTKQANGLLDLELNTGDKITGVDCLLWAIGRIPLSQNIGLEQLVNMYIIIYDVKQRIVEL